MMSRLSVVAVLSAVVLFFAGGAAQPDAGPSAAETAPAATGDGTDQMPEVQKAIEAFKKGDVDGAKTQLAAARAKNADLSPPQVILAGFYSQMNNAAGVRNSLEKAVVETPDDPEAYVVLGDIAFGGGRITEAELLFQKASSLLTKLTQSKKRKDNLTLRVLGGMATVAQAREQWATAQKYLEQVLKLEPKNIVALRRLARVQFQQGNAAGALDQLKLAEAAQPESPNQVSSAATLATFYLGAGDTDNARQWIEYALKKNPRQLGTRLTAAQMMLEMGDFNKAAGEAAAAAQLDPNSLPAKILRGVVALFQQDYAGAAGYFESAHLQAPDNFEAKNNLALALAEQDDQAKKQRALAFAQENARLNQQRPEAISTYGWALYQAGRVAEADRVLQQLLRVGNFAPDTAFYMAQVAYDQGRQDQAKQLLEAALKSKVFSRKADAKALLAKIQ
jgi:tetratricopeptide (TPR) repeat protein